MNVIYAALLLIVGVIAISIGFFLSINIILYLGIILGTIASLLMARDLFDFDKAKGLAS